MVNNAIEFVVVPGDGVGPEVCNAAIVVLEQACSKYRTPIKWEEYPIGGFAIDKFGDPFPEQTRKACENANAVLLGATGGPKWDNLPGRRPEAGLLDLRKVVGGYANLRPIVTRDSLLNILPFKPDTVRGTNILFVRELTGGIYFGEPKYRTDEKAVDTLVYTRNEIERVVRKSFELARSRKKKLCSVDKANILESSRLWRDTVNDIAKEYPDIQVEHQLVDSFALKLMLNPKTYDVVVTENTFGDILTDLAAALTGSLGLLPSASLGNSTKGLYEPVHGTAPDIAGKDIANPIGAILSAAMMLRYSFGRDDIASDIESAVERTLAKGYRTKDIASPDSQLVGCRKMAELISEELRGESN